MADDPNRKLLLDARNVAPIWDFFIQILERVQNIVLLCLNYTCQFRYSNTDTLWNRAVSNVDYQ